MRKLKNILTPVIALVAITLTLTACNPVNQPVAGNPEPESSTTEPAPHPTYAHPPVGKPVPPPVNVPAAGVPAPGSEGQGNFYWVRLITRVYDENGVEATGFNSPKVRFHLDAETASGYPAIAYNQKEMRTTEVPVEWDNYPPIADEQYFQELTEYTDGSWRGILAANWSLTVTLNPGWSITCLVKDMGSGDTVSQHEVKNNGSTTTRGTVHCTWPFDTSIEIPAQH